ncbi:hypothetical protein MSUIS_06310 [Mycoplasma suis KI3806]|uniref:Uncharacterized protein n=1 Tax=Mycoplasma suis (strain KI_3806) TaxID=708248 RepID=F0V243_MYCS3|nr:hypothetical protein [Mycoplasma suis]CBZ40724.1 hypothetical protein MSUIS_06310 [Mycoplasma suis KI3806]
MKALKVSLLSVFTVASLGGGYGLSKLIFKNYVPEEKVLWESVWLLEGGEEKLCWLKTKDNQEINNYENGTEGIKSKGPCFTSWAENLSIKDKKLKTEWWVRGREKEKVVKEVLTQEVLLDDLSDIQKYPQFSQENKNTSFFEENCEFNENVEGSWIIVKCPKNPLTEPTQS